MKQAGYVLGFLLVLILLYVGAYYALATRGGVVSMGDPMNPFAVKVVPEYRVGNEACECMFSTWHELDRKIRPKYWRLFADLLPDLDD
jgi:hypothetical protein